MTSFKPFLLAATLVAGLSGAALAQSQPGPAAPPTGTDEESVIARGEYLARAGDCVACHTAPGGKPFAGGLAIVSDLGTIFSTNITPDKQHGIGNYTEAQFAAALREGVRADGGHLYPAMPYPAYSKVSDEDVHALYAYFMKGVKAEAEVPPQTALGFPFNQRWGMWFWNLAFAPSGTFQPAQGASEEMNRGQYLVEGLGHCGSCHTPRGIGMQEAALTAAGGDSFLSGADLNGWHAPSLRGMPGWSEQDLVDYMGTGRNRFAAVGGEMKAVVEHSLSHLGDADLKAMAVYLKSLPAGPLPPRKPQSAAETTAAKLTAAVNLTLGERLYLDNCGACHFVTGQGAERVFPRLDGASIINAENPSGLIMTILNGAQTPSTQRLPSVLPMTAFADRLSDAEVAELATFLRGAWTNQAAPVTAEQVQALRGREH